MCRKLTWNYNNGNNPKHIQLVRKTGNNPKHIQLVRKTKEETIDDASRRINVNGVPASSNLHAYPGMPLFRHNCLSTNQCTTFMSLWVNESSYTGLPKGCAIWTKTKSFSLLALPSLLHRGRLNDISTSCRYRTWRTQIWPKPPQLIF